MASVYDEVAILQGRLQREKHGDKVLKILKKLHALPVTVEILAETGVGKSVNSLRKDPRVGDVARALVLEWKKLVPQDECAPRPISHRSVEHGRRDQRYPEYTAENAPSGKYSQEGDGDSDMEDRAPPQSFVRQDHAAHNNIVHKRHANKGGACDMRTVKTVSREGLHTTSKSNSSEDLTEKSELPTPSLGKSTQKQKHTSGDGRTKHKASRTEQQTDIPSTRAEFSSRDSRKESKMKPERQVAPRHSKGSLLSDDDFDSPTMPFESYLSYDQPQKKKKKRCNEEPVGEKLWRSMAPAAEAVDRAKGDGSAECVEPVPERASRKQPANSEGQRRLENPSCASRSNKHKYEVVPSLPDITLPLIQPNYRPLPSAELLELSPQKKKVLQSSVAPLEDGFTGKRLNSKMAVYSGTKTAFLPKMMSLYEQCLRVLQNNIDSIHEVGGVPYDILVPVLLRCTPEQLYRIEDCNPSFVEETTELWAGHCARDFRNETRQEYESWRELYLRKYEEREARLKRLTQSISSTHSSKPKGRQVKLAFVNTTVKPPRDVRRKQERHGTGRPTPFGATERLRDKNPVALVPLGGEGHAMASAGGNSDGTSVRPRSLSPVPGPSSSGSSAGGDKRQVKKVAPMMAKTLKAFKNRFGRR
ncbi:elongin-A [Lethenteron reissneri]|uniref:elongin-A n=1 Tax=Lethenteron reissneri TaxID=7753 RepID=UPI002AB6966F|nr:elongin-A [Lethenteron reissneri]